MTYYASFGTPKLSKEAEELISECYKAGYEWGRDGNEKLPRYAVVKGRKIHIIKSIHENAQAFVDGWKTARSTGGF